MTQSFLKNNRSIGGNEGGNWGAPFDAAKEKAEMQATYEALNRSTPKAESAGRSNTFNIEGRAVSRTRYVAHLRSIGKGDLASRIEKRRAIERAGVQSNEVKLA